MQSPPPELVEKYVKLRLRIRARKPRVDPLAVKFKEAETELLAYFADGDARTEYMAAGTKHQVPVSMQQRKRWPINVPAFFDFIGKEKYLAAVPPTLDLIEKMVSNPITRAEYIHEERTGSRTLGEPSIKRAA